MDAGGSAGSGSVADAGEQNARPPCVATAEVCDGKDQDCDGVADNGAKNDCGKVCGQTCPPPTPACTPSKEICDGKDNDCDGTSDDLDFEDCSAGQGECARAGRYECRGSEKVCSVTAGARSAEVCDGRDNDCNGTADDIAVESCSAGQGECRREGRYACEGTQKICNAAPKASQPWYRDCDGDGFAADASGAVDTCGRPATAPGCQSWTQVSPAGAAANRDCDDANPLRYPGASYGVTNGGSGDLNCDGVTETHLEFVTSTIVTGQETYKLCSTTEVSQGRCSGCYTSSIIALGFQGFPLQGAGNVPFFSYTNGAPPCARMKDEVLLIHPMHSDCQGYVESPTIAARNVCR